jgi:hypothetical protein
MLPFIQKPINEIAAVSGVEDSAITGVECPSLVNALLEWVLVLLAILDHQFSSPFISATIDNCHLFVVFQLEIDRISLAV